ncbi:cytochrome c peroxidase [uncultured Polaribacter sp.]|uniref:cytochrome-c peroxidase n=1 Tax=uncultured Polaribacter sp. TaxID=174711 RepID=UPI0030D85A7C|tara:strand:- start:2906 stop:4051 length:1146 start_codon:yes stop_codon:yes gene_type:complete
MIKKSLILICAAFLILSYNKKEKEEYQDISKLRKLYSQPDASKWPKPHLDSLIDKASFKDIGVLPEIEYPDDNAYSNEKKQLGKILFFDPRLSKSGQIACASCHNPELGWTDNSTRSFGHNRQTGRRNSMTILNVAHAKELFWDGRATSLEDQARFPIPDQLEMNMDLDYAVNNLKKIEGYKPLFKKAFGDEEISLQKVQKAIATFERSVKSPPSKFDRFITGKSDKFTDEEVLGLHIFRTKARCINCHNTGYFSDNQFHNDGQTLFGTKDEDFGRYNVTGKIEDIGKFRTPTIREVANTKPWMHHGHFPSLLDVVEFYNLGNPSPIQNKYLGVGRDSLIPKTSPLLKKLNLNKEEIDAVLAFINTLSTPTRRTIIPTLPQ